MSFSGAYQFQSLSRGEIVEANGDRQGGRDGRKEKDSNQNKPAIYRRSAGRSKEALKRAIFYPLSAASGIHQRSCNRYEVDLIS